MSVVRKYLNEWFPERRLDPDFPLALWFGGLWLYLKSFLYICYLYMIGTDEPSSTITVKVEITYFALAFIPAFFLAVRLWNERSGAAGMAMTFLLIDTPILVMHVLRLSAEGFLNPGLTKLLEFGGLGLNILCMAWLGQYLTAAKTSRTGPHKPRPSPGK
ncbi:MAG: hypothetical protein AB1646_07205 [Thermodesulfobacteriota bacterium]